MKTATAHTSSLPRHKSARRSAVSCLAFYCSRTIRQIANFCGQTVHMYVPHLFENPTRLSSVFLYIYNMTTNYQSIHRIDIKQRQTRLGYAIAVLVYTPNVRSKDRHIVFRIIIFAFAQCGKTDTHFAKMAHILYSEKQKCCAEKKGNGTVDLRA